MGRYELVARIGEGGMAEVYLARQRGPMRFEKLVVVKTVHSELTARPDVAAMLLEEARIAALVKHPNVVDIYDLGEEDGTFFIAMEYLEGESMSAVLRQSRQGPRLDPFSTARIITDCAAGLHAAHELRNLAGEHLELVHQDVTPGNIIVLYTGQVKLVDFGVAKIRTTGENDLVKGKAGYLAPEMLAGATADRRSDVFSLGVVLWEALTLRRLFWGKTEKEAFTKIRSGPIPPPSALASTVVRELDEICLHALERDPERRYQTAHEMRNELTGVLRHASWGGDNQPIARFMHAAFADRMVARTELLRELSKRKAPRTNTLERLQAITGDRDGPPTPPADAIVGSHGTGRIEAPAPAGGAAIPATGAAATGSSPTEARRSRRRVVIATAVAVLGVAAVAAAMTLGGGTGGRAPADAGVVAMAAPAAPADAAPPDAAAPADPAPPDAGAIAVAVAPPDAAVREHEHEHHHHHVRPDAGAAVVADPAIPANARSLYKEGIRQFAAGDTDAAIVRFHEALSRQSSYAPAYRGLGMAYERRGDRARARKAFRSYLQLAPRAPDAVQIQARLDQLR
jgi:eukaryotic-like serine/threonine-protein kinase